MKMTTCEKHNYLWDTEQFSECPQCTAENVAEQTARLVGEKLGGSVSIEISPEHIARFEAMSDEESALRALLRALTLQQRQTAARGRKLWTEVAAHYGLEVSQTPYYFDGKAIRKGIAPNQE